AMSEDLAWVRYLLACVIPELGSYGETVLYVVFSSKRRHARLVSDWSSDVCSSDLFESGSGLGGAEEQVVGFEAFGQGGLSLGAEIGRASCREKVDNGGARVNFKK